MKVYFATKNKGKVISVRDGLAPYGIDVEHAEMELPESRSYDVKQITQEKVLYAYEKLQKPCLALDAGFFIPAWNGFPRLYVNFTLETLGIPGILKLVEDMPRECYFKDCIAYRDGSEPTLLERIIDGTIAENPRGEPKEYHWSVLFQIFIPKGKEKTLAEMSKEELSTWKKGLKGYYEELAERILTPRHL